MNCLIASRENHAHFGDCAVGVSKQLSFTLTNHSPSNPIRFQWTPPPEITFSPCVGHLQSGCAKDVTVTFLSDLPKTFNSVNVPCKIVKIKLGETQEKVSANKGFLLFLLTISVHFFKSHQSSLSPMIITDGLQPIPLTFFTFCLNCRCW